MTSVSLKPQGRPSDRVYHHLRGLVLAPDAAVGDRLPTTGQLAADLGVSRPTVLRALGRLEQEGLVDRRQGAGCFVASPVKPLSMQESVVLCMESHGHTWSELTSLIVRRLQHAGRFTSLVDTSQGMTVKPLLERIAYSQARCIVVHGHRYFPFDMLRPAMERGKIVLAASEWEVHEPWPEVGGVVNDRVAAGREVADHLWSRGHRQVLLAGNESQIWELRRGTVEPWLPQRGFLDRWGELGGGFQLISCDPRGASSTTPPTADPAEVLEALQGAKGCGSPTAVFGFMDACTYAVQRAVQQHAPDRLHRLEWVGFNDTPWSQVGNPPFTSVDLDLRRIAERLDEQLRDALTPDFRPTFPARRETLKARLVVREDPLYEPSPEVLAHWAEHNG